MKYTSWFLNCNSLDSYMQAGCLFLSLSVESIYTYIFFWVQVSYNVLRYKGKTRLKTGLELVKTTREIEQRLEEV